MEIIKSEYRNMMLPSCNECDKDIPEGEKYIEFDIPFDVAYSRICKNCILKANRKLS